MIFKILIWGAKKNTRFKYVLVCQFSVLIEQTKLIDP